MNKSELVDRIADRLETSKAEAGRALDAVLQAIGDGVGKDGDVKITGFGNFTRHKRPARMGRNPATGASIEIAAKTTVKFKPGKDLEARV